MPASRLVPASRYFLAVLVGLTALPHARAQDQTVSGNLAVTGDTDLGGNTLSFATRLDLPTIPGLTLHYVDGTPATLYFNATRPAANWLWQQNTSSPQLQLTASNQLRLYNPTTTSATITLDPSAGTALLRKDAHQGQGALLTLMNGLGGQGATIGLNLATYDPGANAPSARIHAIDDMWSAHLVFSSKLPGANANPLVERMRITTTGNVGIGTSTPAEKLDVAGNARVSGTLTVAGAPVLTTTGNGAGLTGLNASQLTAGTVPTGALPSTVVQTTASQTLTNKTLQNATLENPVLTGPSITGPVSITGEATFTGGSDGDEAQISPCGFQYGHQSTVIFMGMVPGIGSDGILLAGQGWIFLSAEGSAAFSGNVAVGDSSSGPLPPSWKGAQIVGEYGYDKVVVGHLVSTYTGATLGAHTSDLNGWADLNIAGTNLLFRTNGETEAARLTSSGNFGIGTTTPAEKLEVTGNAKVSGTVTMNAAVVKTTLRVPPSGDLSMGTFSSGINPAN